MAAFRLSRTRKIETRKEIWDLKIAAVANFFLLKNLLNWDDGHTARYATPILLLYL